MLVATRSPEMPLSSTLRGAVREAGDRAKVAVYSRERDVDPVGACVGMKGTRVQAIIRELRGEKIDIVEWSEDPILFVTNAISPAKVQHVSIVDDAETIVTPTTDEFRVTVQEPVVPTVRHDGADKEPGPLTIVKSISVPSSPFA